LGLAAYYKVAPLDGLLSVHVMDVPEQLNSALASRYLVKREIGAGGMATVYLAEDVKHRRRVALKVLKPEIGAVLGVDRFLAEIRVTAALQHPNLLPLFDSGETDGLLYYVMPFVEGESLRARLDRERQLPIDEALHVASAVASALDYAHGNGVIHRDLKPENILMHAGEPVVADFGIALAVSLAGGARITQTGLSLGTPQYMSPEQATGDRAIDRRTDIYSLGAVTYEMLTGEPPHLGSTVQALVARVLTERPESVRVLRPSVPEHVALAVDRALEKLPADRWSTAREFADALHGRAVATLARRADAGTDPRLARLLTAAIAVLGAIVLTLGWLLIRARGRPGDRQPDVEFTMVPLPGTHADALHFALSPDGRTVAYEPNATPAGEGSIMVREWGTRAPRVLAGTVGALRPFFSPDGRWIGFWSDGRVWRIATTGGDRSELLTAPQPGRGTWLRDGTIFFSSASGFQVAKPGGPVRVVATPDSAHGEMRMINAVVLGDERTIVYSSIRYRTLVEAQLGVMSLDGTYRALLPMKGLLACLGMVDDWLIVVRADGGLAAIPFDPRRREIIGAAVSLDENVSQNGYSIAAAFSTGGTLLYAERGTTADLVWVDEHGAARPLLSRQQFYDLPRLSPDGKRLAVYISPSLGRQNVGDYWVLEIATSTLTRLTTDSASYYGEWLDSLSFVHAVRKDSTWTLVRRRVDGREPPVTLLASRRDLFLFSVPPGGRSLLHNDDFGKGQEYVLVTRALTGDTAPRRVVGIQVDEAPIAFRVSPDGKWLAYTSRESGVEQVYMRPYDAAGPRIQISANGGAEPLWSRDGRRIFFRTDDGRAIWAATITTGPSAAVHGRKKLFEGNYDWDDAIADYDVSAAGEFVMVRFPQARDQVVVALNWADRLRRRLHARN
jgi:serine/threonine-protein kinase